MGKRVIGIILVCACLVGLIGCASEPAKRPYDKEPKTGGATLADFGLYKDGKLTEHLDLKGESAGGSLLVNYRGPLEAENLVYKTWRGIRCSDNIQKLLEAYSDWGMPDDVSFGGISEPIENLNQIKELGSRNWSGELGSCEIEYIWYCKPGTCEFTREPKTDNDVEYRISFSFDNQLGAELILTRVFYNRFGRHPEINIKATQEAEDEQQPSKYQGEILENMSEKEFDLYSGTKPINMKMATEQFPEVWYQINDGTSGFSEYNTLRGLKYQSSVEEFCEAYGDFKISEVYRVMPDSSLHLLSSEQWEGLTLKEFSSKNSDLMKEPLFIEFGVQKQGNTWNACMRNRFTDEKPVEDVTEYWMDVTIENGKVESIYFITYYLGERDLDALYAQIQEERGLTA